MEAVPDAAKADVAAAALQAVPDAAKAEIAASALDAVPDAAKADVATAALQVVPDADRARAQCRSAERSLNTGSAPRSWEAHAAFTTAAAVGERLHGEVVCLGLKCDQDATSSIVGGAERRISSPVGHEPGRD